WHPGAAAGRTGREARQSEAAPEGLLSARNSRRHSLWRAGALCAGDVSGTSQMHPAGDGR
ncbi:MAG: hypothetical protein ACYTGR_09390, partial [Planctomycetota bacterium]